MDSFVSCHDAKITSQSQVLESSDSKSETPPPPSVQNFNSIQTPPSKNFEKETTNFTKNEDEDANSVTSGDSQEKSPNHKEERVDLDSYDFAAFLPPSPLTSGQHPKHPQPKSSSKKSKEKSQDNSSQNNLQNTSTITQPKPLRLKTGVNNLTKQALYSHLSQYKSGSPTPPPRALSADPPTPSSKGSDLQNMMALSAGESDLDIDETDRVTPTTTPISFPSPLSSPDQRDHTSTPERQIQVSLQPHPKSNANPNQRIKQISSGKKKKEKTNSGWL